MSINCISALGYFTSIQATNVCLKFNENVHVYHLFNLLYVNYFLGILVHHFGLKGAFISMIFIEIIVITLYSTNILKKLKA